MDATKLIATLLKSGIGGRSKKRSSHSSSDFGLGTLLKNKSLLMGLGAAGVAGMAYLAKRHLDATGSGAGSSAAPPPPPPPGAGPLSASPQQPFMTETLPPGSIGATQAQAFPPPPPPQGFRAPAPTAAPPALPPPTTNPTATAPPQEASASEALFLVRVMVAAANADHEIDPAEREKILRQAQLLALSGEEQQTLEQEVAHPLHLQGVIAEAKRRASPPRQVYAASLLAMTADSAAEQTYLRVLAQGLGLAETDVREIERIVHA